MTKESQSSKLPQKTIEKIEKKRREQAAQLKKNLQRRKLSKQESLNKL